MKIIYKIIAYQSKQRYDLKSQLIYIGFALGLGLNSCESDKSQSQTKEPIKTQAKAEKLQQTFKDSSDLWAWLPSSEGVATWYGGRSKRCSLENGKVIPQNILGVAHRKIPKGTILLLSYERKFIKAVVNDYGPLVKGIDFDVSREVADSLGFLRKGVAKINYRILGRI